jgi:hypothetical protein
MTELEKVQYTARAHTTGGRDGGASRTDDGRGFDREGCRWKTFYERSRGARFDTRRA